MSIYAIGDIQGCFDDLQKLLQQINFNKEYDKIWFVGDLVNRGPKSLETLRFIKSLQDSAISVLGNHDLHALAVYAGIKKDKRGSLNALLDAQDADELFYWLRCRPLIHFDHKLKFTLVHAGLAADWDLTSALNYGQELHEILSGDNYQKFLKNMYGDNPDHWQQNMSQWQRLRYICNVFTRMRYCFPDGRLELNKKNSPYINDDTIQNKNDLIPWFELKNRKTKKDNIVFGHWSTLGLHTESGVYSIDTGCLWGGKLTALKIDNKMTIYQIDCPKYR